MSLPESFLAMAALSPFGTSRKNVSSLRASIAIAETRIVRCQHCGSEGRIYHSGYAIDYRTGDEIGGWSEECPACNGTGGEEVAVEPITLDDLAEYAP